MTDILISVFASGAAASLLVLINTLIQARMQKRDVTRQALLALLHDRLYAACGMYLAQRWCSVEDKRNLEYMFTPYEKLGGNGVCKSMYTQCLALPTQYSDTHKKEDKQ